jgi:hypothetical protein
LELYKFTITDYTGIEIGRIVVSSDSKGYLFEIGIDNGEEISLHTRHMTWKEAVGYNPLGMLYLVLHAGIPEHALRTYDHFFRMKMREREREREQ